MKKRLVVSTAVVLSMFATLSQAATMAELTGSIQFTDVITAIFAIGALVIGVDLAQIGYMKARKIIRGSH